MQIKRAGSQASSKGPAEHFTGSVRIDSLNSALEPARVSCAYVNSADTELIFVVRAGAE